MLQVLQLTISLHGIKPVLLSHVVAESNKGGQSEKLNWQNQIEGRGLLGPGKNPPAVLSLSNGLVRGWKGKMGNNPLSFGFCLILLILAPPLAACFGGICKW